MSEVLPSLVRAFVEVIEDADLDPVGARAGLPAIERALRGEAERVPWDEYAAMLNRVGTKLTPVEQELLGERYTGFVSEFRVLAQLAVSPVRLFRVALGTLHVTWPHARFEHAWVGEREATVDVEVPAPYLPCPLWLRASVGLFRALPRLMSLPDAEVEHELGERGGHYRLRLPASGTIVARARRAVDARELRLLADHLLDAVIEPPRPSIGSVPDVLTLQRAWGLTRMEARVARRLATGMRLKDVARDLGISQETARTHLKQLFSKTDTNRQVALVALLRGLPLDRSE
ncbi:helix-turn-helix transcriptional regulator [Sandaracinus amylolyticus]|uniref:helix-turn-helix transcriptional regulator n=1 Tax=Sandaracinus amylolyticus TaxID=927083 RepID=UPI001F283679|nr:helix-turn-helix transcriptional regulator [Sandaracinus amylolyticus]UJR86769.1 Hypothetical protein I5071_88700 [Sandaracinus amylolyticus]